MTPAQRDEFIARIDERTLRVLQSLESIQKDQRAFDDRLSAIAESVGGLRADHAARIATLEADNNSHKSAHRWANARALLWAASSAIGTALGVKSLEGLHL